MTVLTKDQESVVRSINPELGFIMRLCKEIISLANTRDGTKDDFLIAARNNLLSEQVALLATAFKVTEQWWVSQAEVSAKLTEIYGETIMKDAERFAKLADTTIPLDEKIEMIREYYIFQATTTLGCGARLPIELRDDQYWFDGIKVDQYFSTFVVEYRPLAQALANKYNHITDMAKSGFEHRFYIAHNELVMLVEMLYTLVFTAVQVARQVPRAQASLKAKGVDLDRLIAFVQGHIRGWSLRSQAETLLTPE